VSVLQRLFRGSRLTTCRTGNELTPSAKYDFKFKDYAPEVFRKLRNDIFGLDPSDYLVSLTSKYILSELGSPGKSGSFFYFSRDYKYIIKTIHHAEHKLLRKVLREYYDHMKDCPNSLLSQFYGLHRVKIPYGKKIHFVIMNNLFPAHLDIHRTFDLKGSTIGREFKEEDLEKAPRATLKDLNWLRRNSHLEFGPSKKQLFVEQIQKDVELLKKLKIMDYSLLVGIHDVSRGNEENLRDRTLQVFQPMGDAEDSAMISDRNHTHPGLVRTASTMEAVRKAKELRQTLKSQKPVPMGRSTTRMPDELPRIDKILGNISGDAVDGKDNHRPSNVFYLDEGGFQASHDNDTPGEEIYYLGIIDCLTKYSMIKRSEHFFKSFTNPEAEISAIPPDRYGARFLKFMTNVTVPKENALTKEKSGEYGVRERTRATVSRPSGDRRGDAADEPGATTLPVVEESPDATPRRELDREKMGMEMPA
jgi:1-phosphatidylinositol-4-phosphate 5-kinase